MTAHTKNAMKLFEYALSNNLAGTQKELCEKIGLVQTNIAEIRNGRRSFTIDQLYLLLKLTNGSADWVLGLSTEMFRTKKSKKPIQQFDEAVAVVRSMIK
jgi:transcriptional regulator with XRE-family HTH domain